MSKVKQVFRWIVQYHKSILAFLIILGMGMGIMPTVERGKGFVAAIKFEQMVETSLPHIIAKEIEMQSNLYVLAIDADSPEYVVAWTMTTGEVENVPDLIYTFFYLLNEYYPGRAAYYIVLADAVSVKTIDGEHIVVRGFGEYGVGSLGMSQLLERGQANAKDSLDQLYANGTFWFVPYYYNLPELDRLMEREPGHIPPWEVRSEEAE